MLNLFVRVANYILIDTEIHKKKTLEIKRGNLHLSFIHTSSNIWLVYID